MRPLWTFDDVVDALGGAKCVAAMTGCNYVQAVSVWRRRGKFPTKFYFVMKAALEDKGFYAPIELWGFFGEHKKSA